MLDAHRFNVVIAGSGPAAIEAALVLRRLAGDLVKTTILTPDEQFVHLPMTVLVPFSRSGGERHSLDQLTGAADAVLRRGTLASVDPASREIRTGAGEILACAGVAGLEALLALRALLGDQVDITVVAPEVKFVNRSMTVARPSMPSRRHGLPLRDVATDLGADWRRGTIDRVAPARRTVVTGVGTELLYDRLVVAMGARAERQWHSKGVLTYHGRQDRPAFRLLLRRLREGGLTRLAFVKPVGATWPLPLYDLALTTAVELRDREVELSLITPEREPLEVFGSRVSASIRELLDDHGSPCTRTPLACPAVRAACTYHQATGGCRSTASSRCRAWSAQGRRACRLDATGSSPRTPTVVWQDWTTCSPQGMRRLSRSSRAVWPPSKPTQPPRRSPRPWARTSIQIHFGRCFGGSCWPGTGRTTCGRTSAAQPLNPPSPRRNCGGRRTGFAGATLRRTSADRSVSLPT